MNKKTLIGIIVGIICVLGAYYLVQHLFFKQPSFDTTMIEMSNTINKLCPLTVDSETQLNNTSILPNKIFKYNYTLIHINKDTADVNTFRKIMEPRLINTVKTDPQMQLYRDNKVTFLYSYKDKNDSIFTEITVSPDLYKE